MSLDVKLIKMLCDEIVRLELKVKTLEDDLEKIRDNYAVIGVGK